MNPNPKTRRFLLVLLAFSILFYTFMYGIMHGMDKTLPNALGRQITAMGIAISDLRYGVHGYKAYSKVVSYLSAGFGDEIPDIRNYIQDPKPIVQYAQHINAAIDGSLRLSNPSEESYNYLLGDDLGTALYYKLAFLVFDYRVQSFYYFYFLLLSFSVAVFLISFYDRLEVLYLLVVFLCAHFVAVASAPWGGIELQTVYNPRFIPVLGILPAMHIALLLYSRGRFPSRDWYAAAVQVLILTLVAFVRTSALYQALFLVFIFLGSIFLYWLQKPRSGTDVFNKIRYWPVMMVVCGLLLLQAHLFFALKYPYDTKTARHGFWLPAYIGLCAHPQSKSIYGIQCDDSSGTDLVFKLTGRREVNEEILKRQYVKILKENPSFVIESYFYKIPMFFNAFFDPAEGAGRFVWDWKILMALVFGALLSYQSLMRQWGYYLAVMIIGFIFSLLPSLLFVPQGYLMSDASLVWAMVMFIAFSGLVCVACSIIKSFFPVDQV